MEFRRDTGIYSSEELSTPADFQRSREYHSPYYSGTSDLGDTAGILGPSSDLGGRQPAQSWTGEWPETPDGSYSDLPTSGCPSYVTETRCGGRRQGGKYRGDYTVDLERKLAGLQRQMAERRRELTPGATPGLSWVDRSTTQCNVCPVLLFHSDRGSNEQTHKISLSNHGNAKREKRRQKIVITATETRVSPSTVHNKSCCKFPRFSFIPPRAGLPAYRLDRSSHRSRPERPTGPLRPSSRSGSVTPSPNICTEQPKELRVIMTLSHIRSHLSRGA